jgi:hypothetical protein
MIWLLKYFTYNYKNDIHNLTLMAGNTVSKSFGNWQEVLQKISGIQLSRYWFNQ